MGGPVKRITLFKVKNQDDIPTILDQYKDVKTKALKDGKPYILAIQAGPTHDDPRSMGYNFCAYTSFASLEDMQYYDTQCEAHAALKAVLIPLVAPPPMTVYLDVEKSVGGQ
ncbi:stress responsive A/B barrel domain protein [Eremomyces bilateralis CBS 781.70]|uniref:Stress responsive A/B barrel domain protein n=1 Tax=Eremomyces bilateralis CBS 781.70 TaxID=1392243 RepID=A0A6G1G6B3_9PEZI|nr:stress responsive A/B barrel domain protein [Eremomyces bilateralis CBS 781.70]KAF1813574.1 stress responsive A/B barrel domain protein [Eremomyces bilateralis CBS 781.70]